VKALAAGSVGNLVEWYDFAIYSASIPVVAKLFFPSGNETAALLSAFALYGVAFLTRPLGGIFWGHLGDKLGRRNVLATIVLLMGASTMAIGLLPTYPAAGLLAPILLALCRLLQGFSGGGEFTGATSFITEFAPAHRRGLYAATSATFTTLPAILGALTVLGFRLTMSAEAFSAWGWRIPFLIGGPLAVVGLIIRLTMDETPAFKHLAEHQELERAPLREAVGNHRRNILLVFAIASLSGLGAYTLGTYFITYLSVTIGVSPTTALLANSAALAVTVPLVPLIGLLGDRIGRKPLLFIGSAGFIVLSVPGFLLASQGSLPTAVLGQLLVALPWSFVVAAVVVTQVEIFPTRVRYSASSIGYNLAYMAFGGTAPLVAAGLVSLTGSNIAPALYLVAVAAVVFLVVFALPETSRVSLLQGVERPAAKTPTVPPTD
jgi:MHS family proline/betaine transporter-like MFS transporter